MIRMLHLDKDTYFYDIDEEQIVYNDRTKVMLRVNEATIVLLRLCNGRYSIQNIVDKYDASIQQAVKDLIQYLLNNQMIHEDDSLIPRTRKYEDIGAFFLSLTSLCNLQCHFCLKYKEEKTKELTVSEWKNVIDIIKDFNKEKKTIFLSGGEPLIINYFHELYQYIYENEMKINVFTNGTLLRDEEIQLFYDYPPNAILISIDGSTKKIHDKQRVVIGAFDQMMNGTRKILEHVDCEIIWQTVINKENLDDMEPIAQLASQLGVRHIHYGMISEMGKGANNTSILSESEMLKFFDQLIRITQNYKGKLTVNQSIAAIHMNDSHLTFSSCGIGNMIHINERGMVSPCYGMNDERFSFGPIHSAEDLRDSHFKHFYDTSIEDYQECASCGIRNLCNGGCKSEILNMTGDINGCNTKKRLALTRYIKNRINSTKNEG